MTDTHSRASDKPELEKLMTAAKLGWWKADFKRQLYICSDFVARLLGLDSDRLSFREFAERIRKDYRPLITEQFTSIRFKETYEQLFPIHAAGGEVWVRSVMAEKTVSPEGEISVLGTMQMIEEPSGRTEGQYSEHHFNTLISQQNNICYSLLSFLHSEKISTVIETALQEIRAKFNGSRIAMFEYDHGQQTQTCTYEIVAPGNSNPPMIRHLRLDDTPWWSQRILSGLPVIVGKLDELPAEASAEKTILESQNVGAVIATPLISRDQVLGHIMVDTAGERNWTLDDYQWLSSVTNLISVCMQFHASEIQLRLDKQDIYHLYKYMPTGYLRLKMIYDQGKVVDFRYIDANAASSRILGDRIDQLIGRRAGELGILTDTDLLASQEIVNTDKHKNLNFRIPGTERYCHAVLYSPIKDEIVALFTDITEEINTRQALEKSESQLRNIYKNLPVGIELYDKDGTMIDINDKELEIFGLTSKEDALGINLFENPNIPEDLKAKLRNHEDVDFSLHYDFTNVESYFPTRQRGKIYLVTKVTCLYDSRGEFTNYMFINIDNTETSSAYSKIQEFEEMFSLIGRHAQVGYAHFDAYTREGYAISSWYENLGEVPGTPLNQIVGILPHVHPDDKAVLKGFFEQVYAGTASHMRLDARVLPDGGKQKWVRINLVVKEYCPEEHRIQMACVNYDITNLKETEAMLLEAKDKAEMSDRLKSAFLANMSHEIRTPLNAIVGFSNLLVETEDPQKRSQYISIVQENNELLLQLISDILDLSKIEAGTLEFVTERVDARQLCQEIVQAFTLKTPANVKLGFDPASPEISLRGDKNRLRQVLANFLTNAMKFTTEGRITLGYERLPDQQVRFFVRDTGIGIAEEQIDTIFNRFIKLNTFAQGTGLGLSICKSVVKQMGGRIGVESEPGRGSTFWFTHPCENGSGTRSACIPEETSQQAAPRPLDTPGGPNPLVLVAEDIDSNYLLIETLLNKEYRLLHARNGKEAIELFAAHRPDFVLMDLKMPEMDGLEATRIIRTQDKQVPIVAITAFAFDKDKLRALEAGCNDYIAKPLSASRLKETLHKWLGQEE